MTKLIDTIMILIDIALIFYFFNYAVSTTDMATRLISCAAVTMEISFIIRHFKIIKKSKEVH
ncbi:hypothetical protein [Romboutsia lituseburensis]|uniref:Uncharacterized protein n=1 Tax=Romboutsia lituseburensis DSM 797 TaxID=1121325 RepID=A0A1G9IZS9_9FIRM|nr:hypothetical protein [Romboutsia lituseburensis]CEH33689.1 Hypothetical protein RLITU_1093 [Romboutsia lituseburensis]SDL30758.1 hypothetical protein SAMN04515677_101450 [Romboutsia lituseburensis DSM 797]